MVNVNTTSDTVNTGTRNVAELVGGSILPDSLMVINGESQTGKSVLCQHLAYNALLSRDSCVVYYTIFKNFNQLLAQMEYFSLDVQHFFVTDRFRICPLSSFDIYDDPEKTARLLVDCIEEISARFNLMIVDSVTPFLCRLQPEKKYEVFRDFRKLCRNGRSLIIVTDGYALDKGTLPRIYMMSDYYIRMRTDELKFGIAETDNRSIKVMDVRKLRGADVTSGESIKFEIKPRVGIQVLPFIKVKV